MPRLTHVSRPEYVSGWRLVRVNIRVGETSGASRYKHLRLPDQEDISGCAVQEKMNPRAGRADRDVGAGGVELPVVRMAFAAEWMREGVFSRTLDGNEGEGEWG
jgi:hypothetical protein